jgi:hypothetical protein
MKKSDWLFMALVVVIIAPFIIFSSCATWFNDSTAMHPYFMAFAKFAILATLGESLGLRIKRGVYNEKGFGIAPRMIVWGLLGVGIACAMKVFYVGVPVLLESFGINGIVDSMKSGALTWKHLLGSFSVSVTMNCIFAPIFMTFHKISDTHILAHNGSLKSLITPIHMGDIMSKLNWKVQWNFVFKKTIPFFWIPAHTITFLLPAEFRVLFAAFLGVALGVILSIAAVMGNEK